MKFTFKRNKETGRFAAFHQKTTNIKHKGKQCGIIRNESPAVWTISLMVIKDSERFTDDNPNCAWKWIRFTARFATEEQAREFVRSEDFSEWLLDNKVDLNLLD